jgi:hypothetical protein
MFPEVELGHLRWIDTYFRGNTEQTIEFMLENEGHLKAALKEIDSKYQLDRDHQQASPQSRVRGWLDFLLAPDSPSSSEASPTASASPSTTPDTILPQVLMKPFDHCLPLCLCH